MSKETFEAMEAAIAAHIADDMQDTGDTVLTGWLLQCSTTRMDPEFIDKGMTGFVRFVPENQSFLTTLGLGDYLHTMLHLTVTQNETGGGL